MLQWPPQTSWRPLKRGTGSLRPSLLIECLVLRQLRHSCVVQLARAGCTVPEIAAITGHSISSVGRILSVYLPRDSTVARNAQVKRGIVNEAVG